MAARIHVLAATLAWMLAPLAHAQEPPPLSAIDWLNDLPAQTAEPARTEPASATTANTPEVTVTPLDGPAARRVGLVPADVTGLPDTIWATSQGSALAGQLGRLPHLRLPALQQLAMTLVLAEAAPPRSDADRFDLARIDMLSAYGALDPAVALLSQAGTDASRAHFARAMDLALIQGNESTACAILRAKPALSPGKGHEIFCHARAGDWGTAALLLGSARVLDLLPETQIAALERFLDPELFEGAPDLPLPDAPDALMFRLYAAAGQPIPTRGWPVLYANADLADTAGWKTRIEAAERLAQNSALAANRLLGLYSARQAAASGGVWDRVRAVQRFETALNTHSDAAIAKTLPDAWRTMGDQGLQVLFAGLFAERFETTVLSGASADTAFDVMLLSPLYETAKTVFPARAVQHPVLEAIASGEVPGGLEASGLGQAALLGFSSAAPDAGIVALARAGALGAAILDTLALAHAGSTGDVAAFGTALATMRALGLEDVARRTALQTLLLEPRG